MKNSITLLSLANTYFNKLRDESDEPIFTYNDEYMPYFVRQSIKGGRGAALNQYYKCNISDEVFNNISKKLNNNVNICEILDNYFEFINKHRKTTEDEYDSHFVNYRYISQDEKTNYINVKRT